jgi:hypothetical protein
LFWLANNLFSLLFVFQDNSGLIYVLICQVSYPQRCAHACLEEVQSEVSYFPLFFSVLFHLFIVFFFLFQFSAKYGDKALTAKDRALDKVAANLLMNKCQKFDNLAEVDKLAAVQKKVESVKIVMQENVDIALQNCVKLETIEKAAEELQQQAGVFKRNANELKKKMWWKNIKMKLIIAFIILAILGIIIGVAVAMSKQK